MNLKAEAEVNNFIQDALLAGKDKGEIVITLRTMILKTAPGAREEIKYNKRVSDPPDG